MSGQSITFRPEDIDGAAKPQTVTFSASDIDSAPDTTEAPDAPGPLSRFASNAWQQMNPVEIVRGLGESVMDLFGTIKGLLEAQGQVGTRAWEDLKAGNPEAARHALHYFLPILGPALDQMSEQIKSGDVAGGLGAATGLGLGVAGPAAAAQAGPLRVRGLRNPNPVVAEAVDTGLAGGIPVDMATATGNRAVAAGQHLADRSIGGSMIAGSAERAQAEALASRLRALSKQAHAQPFTPETAGAATQEAVRSRVGRLGGVADRSYGELRRIEAMPAHQQTVPVTETGHIGGSPFSIVTQKTMGLPVDLRPVKAALGPIYDDIMRRSPPAIVRASPGAKAIENIVKGPDFSPLSVADADLSAIKAMARENVLPELRNISQGVAAKAVGEFEAAIQRATEQAGPRATQVRSRGRTATQAKHESGEALRGLGEEPVGTYRRLVQPGDASIERLREVQRLTPKELPKIGRAALEDLVKTATAEGEFSKPATLWASWQQIGPATKRMLYTPEHIKALDRFFLLAKKMGENPNPSGTAHTALIYGQAGGLVFGPGRLWQVLGQVGAAGVSKMLHSPTAVRALTKGFELSRVTKPAAATAAMTELIKAASEAGVTNLPETVMPRPRPAHTGTR